MLAGIQTRILLVSGTVAAKSTFTAEEIPANGTNGWFVVWPDSEETGDDNGGTVQDRIAMRCEMLWRINPTEPQASIGAAMDMALAIRSKLRDGSLVAVDNGAHPSMAVGEITYQRSADALHIVVSIPIVLDVYTSV